MGNSKSRRHRAARPPRARGQRGAAAVFAAISIITGLIAVGLSIDLGRLYYTQRDLQRLANLAALDSARVAGGCLGTVPDPGAAALTEALASVLRNGGEAGWVQSTAASILGRRVIEDGLRSFQQPTRADNRAVQVHVARAAPSRLIPLLGSGSGATLNAYSAAYSTPSALVQVGSRPLTFDPPDGGALDALFSQLLGGPVSLDVLSYQALFDAQVPLGGVLDDLGRGPGRNPADAPARLADLILAVADRVGDPTASAAARAMYAAAEGSRSVIPEQVLGIDDPASASFASAGDVLTAAAAASLDGAPIDIPLTLPPPFGPGSSGARLLDPGAPARLLPGGVLADAQNFAHNTSLLLQTDAPLDLAALGATGQMSFFVQAGQSTAEVDSIRCARRGEPEDMVDVSATASLTRIGIGRFDDINAPNPVPLPVTVVDADSSLSVLGQSLPIHVRITAAAFVDVGQADSASFDGMRAGEVRRMGSLGPSALAQALAEIPGNLAVEVDVSLLGPVSPLIQGAVNTALAALDSTLTAAVTDAITGTLVTEIDAVLLPQLQVLGVTIGGADVIVDAILADEPLLFTH